MTAVVQRLWMPAAASVALLYLAIMLVTGALPERRHLVQSEAHGVLQMAPERVTRVTVVADALQAVFVRQADGWIREGSEKALDAELAATIERAVKFMHTANPVRILEPEEIADAGVAEFGLDHPRLAVTLEDARGVVLEAEFGNNSADGLLQYMRLRDQDGLYLMSGFVGKEWQAAIDGGHGGEGHGDAAQAPRSLVPVSIDDVAAVEILARDGSYRFERDHEGAWLLHRHAPGDDLNAPHRADPAQSERIAQALTAFSRTQIGRSVAYGAPGDAFGLLDPEAIILLFTDDQARPPLDFAAGDLADGADLSGADLREAQLRFASLRATNLENAKLSGAALFGAMYEAAAAPARGHLTGLQGLTTVRFRPGQGSGLAQLRTQLAGAGLRDLERQATYALERQTTRHKLRDWKASRRSALEGGFRLVAFEWPVGYGLYPGFALELLLWSIGGFAVLYAVALVSPLTRRAGIWRVWAADRVVRRQGQDEPERLDDDWYGDPWWHTLYRVPLRALQFSILSAFHLGFREIDVGSWIARVQAQEYTLRATGWVRVVAGLQSLLSVYLLALWALTYFGRPFQ